MDRLACVDVRSLALQVFLRQRGGHPGEWPAAVLDGDGPQAKLIQVNRCAFRQGVRPGMRFAAALSLAPELRAGPVDEAAIAAARDGIVATLQGFSPSVEPAEDQPGLFWLDASGLERLMPSLSVWARGVRQALDRAGWRATVAVAFSRFGAWMAARGARSVLVLEREADEDVVCGATPLHRLGLRAAAVDELARLDIRTIGELRAHPPSSLRRRFGPEVARLCRLARGELALPVQGVPEHAPVCRREDLEPHEKSLTRLLFRIKRWLPALVRELGERHRRVAAIDVRMTLDDGSELNERIGAAEPTRDEATLIDLIRLHLDRVQLTSPVVALEVEVSGPRAAGGQMSLSIVRPPRDLDAANRGLARVRARLGKEAVVKAELRSGHLPEDRFVWSPLATLEAPDRRAGAPIGEPILVRRDRGRRVPEPTQTWQPLGTAAGPVVELGVPVLLSGRWWGEEADREYRYAILEDGSVAWLCLDRHRGRWSLAATVE